MIDKADLASRATRSIAKTAAAPMVLKKGRFGTFFACSGYPDCKTTKQIGGTQKKADVPLDEKCPQLRQQPGAEVRPLRRVHGVQQLSGVQVREAEDHRREVPRVFRRRHQRAAFKTRQDVLRLHALSGLQFRGLGQTSRGEVSGLRRLVPGREVPEGRSGSAMPERECKFKRVLEAVPA